MVADNIFDQDPECEHGNLADECDICLAQAGQAAPPWTPPKLSVDDATLDSMIQAASIPNLAVLIRRGKEQGLLKPITGYGEGA